MVIQITSPSFALNEDNPFEVAYDNDVIHDGRPWTTKIVQTYLPDFPRLKLNEILYMYTENRGFIYNTITKKGRARY